MIAVSSCFVPELQRASFNAYPVRNEHLVRASPRLGILFRYYLNACLYFHLWDFNHEAVVSLWGSRYSRCSGFPDEFLAQRGHWLLKSGPTDVEIVDSQTPCSSEGCICCSYSPVVSFLVETSTYMSRLGHHAFVETTPFNAGSITITLLRGSKWIFYNYPGFLNYIDALTLSLANSSSRLLLSSSISLKIAGSCSEA